MPGSLTVTDYHSKKLMGTLYTRANSLSSTKSTRRSPDSHLEMNDCGFSIAEAASSCVKLARFLAVFSRLRKST